MPRLNFSPCYTFLTHLRSLARPRNTPPDRSYPDCIEAPSCSRPCSRRSVGTSPGSDYPGPDSCRTSVGDYSRNSAGMHCCVRPICCNRHVPACDLNSRGSRCCSYAGPVGHCSLSLGLSTTPDSTGYPAGHTYRSTEASHSNSSAADRHCSSVGNCYVWGHFQIYSLNEADNRRCHCSDLLGSCSYETA